MAAVNKLTQLHVMDTWKPMYADKLSREQRIASIVIAAVPKRKEEWRHKGKSMR